MFFRGDGIKYIKARDWGVPVVNVQWVNEILLGHYSAVQITKGCKYQQFNLEDPFTMDTALIPHLMGKARTRMLPYSSN